MEKRYIVRLNDTEREECFAVIEKSEIAPTKIRRANILLKADAYGHNWNDQQIADKFSCTRQCVENVRKCFATDGFSVALHGKKRQTPPRKRLLDDEQEEQLIALYKSRPPKWHRRWTHRLLAEKAVELGIAPQISVVAISRIFDRRSNITPEEREEIKQLREYRRKKREARKLARAMKKQGHTTEEIVKRTGLWSQEIERMRKR